MTRAYQLAQTSYAAIFEYAYLLSVSYFSWLFWDVTPNALGVVGIVFIIASGVIITLAQRKRFKPTYLFKLLSAIYLHVYIVYNCIYWTFSDTQPISRP